VGWKKNTGEEICGGEVVDVLHKVYNGGTQLVAV